MTVIAPDMPVVTTAEIDPPELMPDDLLTMENDGLFELVDGRLVEKQMSYLANRTSGELIFHLKLHLVENRAGDVIPEQSFRCFPGRPRLVRRPDIAVIVAARVPPVLPSGHVEVAPDLAVEIVSPTNTVYEMDGKVDDYRSAGVRLVWVINPDARVVRVHQPGQPIEELRGDDVLRGEPVLPGFAMNVSGLWPAVVATPAPTSNP